jgi:hypothetical protein
MPGLRLIVKQYRLLWEALKHYEQQLENLRSSASDEDQRVEYTEDLEILDGILTLTRRAAETDWPGIKLE